MTNFLIRLCLLSVVLVEPIHSHFNDEDKLSVAWCVSGQVGRFTFHEQVDFSKATVVDVYIVLENNDVESTLSSHGNISSLPYFEEARHAQLVMKFYKERGANQVTLKLVSPAQTHKHLHKLAKTFINKIGPQVHALTHELKVDRYNRAGPMFYLRHLVFALAVSSGDYDYFIVLREDNVFLSPYASLTDILMKLHESKQTVSHVNSSISATSRIRQNVPGGGHVALDMNCDGWGAYSDKIYATDLAGGSSIFSATTPAFSEFIGHWLRHGIRCLYQLHPLFPQEEQYANMIYLEKYGIQSWQEMESQKQQSTPQPLEETINATLALMKRKQRLRQQGHIPTKAGELRCNPYSMESLQPESFLQDFMDFKLVKIHPVDFGRTEVRYIEEGNGIPCVSFLYYNCAPALKETRAFENCANLKQK